MKKPRPFVPGKLDRITRDTTPNSPEWAIDEVVLTDVTVHYEVMDDNAAMLMITGPGGLHVHLDLWAGRDVRSDGTRGTVLRLYMLDSEGLEPLGDRVEVPER